MTDHTMTIRITTEMRKEAKIMAARNEISLKDLFGIATTYLNSLGEKKIQKIIDEFKN